MAPRSEAGSINMHCSNLWQLLYIWALLHLGQFSGLLYTGSWWVVYSRYIHSWMGRWTKTSKKYIPWTPYLLKQFRDKRHVWTGRLRNRVAGKLLQATANIFRHFFPSAKPNAIAMSAFISSSAMPCTSLVVFQRRLPTFKARHCQKHSLIHYDKTQSMLLSRRVMPRRKKSKPTFSNLKRSKYICGCQHTSQHFFGTLRSAEFSRNLRIFLLKNWSLQNLDTFFCALTSAKLGIWVNQQEDFCWNQRMSTS